MLLADRLSLPEQAAVLKLQPWLSKRQPGTLWVISLQMEARCRRLSLGPHRESGEPPCAGCSDAGWAKRCPPTLELPDSQLELLQ